MPVSFVRLAFVRWDKGAKIPSANNCGFGRRNLFRSSWAVASATPRWCSVELGYPMKQSCQRRHRVLVDQAACKPVAVVPPVGLDLHRRRGRAAAETCQVSMADVYMWVRKGRVVWSLWWCLCGGMQQMYSECTVICQVSGLVNCISFQCLGLGW